MPSSASSIGSVTSAKSTSCIYSPHLAQSSPHQQHHSTSNTATSTDRSDSAYQGDIENNVSSSNTSNDHEKTNVKFDDMNSTDQEYHKKKLQRQRSKYEKLISKLDQDHEDAMKDLHESYKEKLERQKEVSLELEMKSVKDSVRILANTVHAFVERQEESIDISTKVVRITARATVLLTAMMGLFVIVLVIVVFITQTQK